MPSTVVTAASPLEVDPAPKPFLSFHLALVLRMGVWRARGPCRLPFPRLSLYALYILSAQSFIVVGGAAQVARSYDDIEVLTEALGFLCTFGVNLHKLANMVAYERRFKYLLRLVENNFGCPQQRTDPEHRAILNACERESRLVFYVLFSSVLTTGTAINFFPLTEWYFFEEPHPDLAANGTSAYQWRFPYRLALPFDTSDRVVFWVIYAYQCSIGWMHLLAMPGTDSFYIALLNHAYGQCRVLRCDLHNLRRNAAREAGDPEADASGSTPATRHAFRRLLRGSVQHHKAILSYTDCLEELLNKPMLTQFFASSICFCTTAFQILTFPTEMLKLVAMVAFCAGEGAQLWVYCFFANRVTSEVSYRDSMPSTEVEAVGESAYGSEWYGEDAAAKRSLSLVMTRARRPTRFSIAKFSDLTLDTFASVVKGSYTYLMLLMKMKE